MNDTQPKPRCLCPACWSDVEPDDTECPFCVEDLVDNPALDKLPPDAVEYINAGKTRKKLAYGALLEDEGGEV